ncbi:hypothetical protein DFH11DRAFT_210542 [Phellopilus nigrolimitatus]|nr:hypothetical protein DFH11DRAFT_210542 [Phellopilus nigrolimitatus]
MSTLKIEKDPEEQVGGYLTFNYPKLPENVDFETFRKTDDDWQKIMTWYNGEKSGTKNVEGSRYRKERFVLLQWPRNPDGPPMKITPRGKDTGNGCELWGATLYDFYRIHRIPSCPNLSTISSGSKLAAWMKEIGELDWAQNQLKQAELEEEPHQIIPFPIGQFLEVLEDQVWKGCTGKSMDIDRKDDKEGNLCLYRPSLYPAPWPLKPFSTPVARLQKIFPHSFLPRKLIVHDPWNVLEVTSRESRRYQGYDPSGKNLTDATFDFKWGSKPDLIRTYNLRLTEEAAKRQNPQHIGSRPEGYQICPAAHLYITPKRRIGKGHHSFVYQVELELPRDMLVDPKMCFQCAVEKFTVDWEKRKHGGNDDERNDTKADKDVQQLYSLMFKNNEPFQEADRLDQRYQVLKHITWQCRPPFCKHLDRGTRAPPSQKVSVTAKLTLPDDRVEAHSRHLRDEAAAYQEFPRHMFEHWNGYNVLQPLKDPTPVGAVVPQFYGFYVPDEENEAVKAGRYMSPILLLEHCGVQVDTQRLTMDQRQECFSLLRRLHAAGYLHNSIYQRNILMQYGPLSFAPPQRSKNHLRFRLIDFGRTEKANPDHAFNNQSAEFSRANENLMLEMF